MCLRDSLSFYRFLCRTVGIRPNGDTTMGITSPLLCSHKCFISLSCMGWSGWHCDKGDFNIRYDCSFSNFGTNSMSGRLFGKKRPEIIPRSYYSLYSDSLSRLSVIWLTISSQSSIQHQFLMDSFGYVVVSLEILSRGQNIAVSNFVF